MMDYFTWSNFLINWLNFRRLIKLIIKTFDQLKSVQNFGQLIMKVLINWKNTILINWFSVKRPPVETTKCEHWWTNRKSIIFLVPHFTSAAYEENIFSLEDIFRNDSLMELWNQRSLNNYIWFIIFHLPADKIWAEWRSNFKVEN